MPELVLDSPAKVNLGLWVGRKRADGFHEIVTVIAPVELADCVAVTRTTAGIRVTCDSRAVPTGRKNLAWRAAAAFLEAARLSDGCRVRITKRIPIGGGLGGGSSNAATVLTGLNRLFGAPLDRHQIFRIGAAIGSDVPAFLIGGPSVARGRGDRLRRIRLPRVDLLLCFPGHAVSTAWAYAEFDRQRKAGRGLTRPVISPKILRAALRRNESERVAAQLRNSFEPVVFRRFPALERAKVQLLRHGALAASLSGSGSTVYGLVRTRGWKDPMAALARSGFHCVKTSTTPSDDCR